MDPILILTVVIIFLLLVVIIAFKTISYKAEEVSELNKEIKELRAKLRARGTVTEAIDSRYKRGKSLSSVKGKSYRSSSDSSYSGGHHYGGSYSGDCGGSSSSSGSSSCD